ncbi:UNVERIFIED_CONTAM: hypothetical protein FKN15_043271 [Acipenser sinensis]
MGQQRPDGRTERGWKRAAPINIDTQSGEKKRQTPSDKDSEGTGSLFPHKVDTYRNIEQVYLNMVMDKLCELIKNGLLKNLESDELKITFCEIFQYILKFVPPGYESAVEIRSDRVKGVCTSLIEIIGTQTKQKCLVGYLYVALKIEGMDILQEIQSDSSDEGTGSSSSNKISSHGPLSKKPKTQVICSVDMKTKSKLWGSLDRRLMMLLCLVKEQPLTQTLSALEGVAVILHLAALCSCHCCPQPPVSSYSNMATKLNVDGGKTPEPQSPSTKVQLVWITPELISQVLEICRKMLVCANRENNLDLATEQIVRIIDAILYMHALQTQAHCVYLLSLLPKNTCPDWRSAIYRWALQSQSEAVRASAVKAFPKLLHHLGIKSYSLIHEVLLNKLQDNSILVKQELAGIIGELACCLSEAFELRMQVNEPTGHDLLCSHLIVNSAHAETVTTIGASVFTPFLMLLRAETSSSVKSAFIENVPHLCKHVNLGNHDPDTKAVLSALVNLMEDPDKDVRMLFSKNIKYLLESWETEQGALKELIVSRLKEAYTNAKTARNNELKNTLILTTGEIGRAAKGELVPFALLHLMHCLLSKAALVSVSAYTEIRALASARSLKLPSFFNQYKKPICQFLVESLHSRHMAALTSTPGQSNETLQQEAAHQREVALDILSQVAHVFNFPDLNRFLNRTLQVLLPYLAAKASSTGSALIRTIAKQLNMNRREILISNFKYIFSHLVCSCSKDELARAFHYLKSETEIELGSLLRQDFQGLHNELLLRLGEHYQQVFNGLAILASFASSDDPYQGPRDITTPELMADYLQPKLLGILAFFNMHLLSSSVGEKEKKKMALNSLVSLMMLMGPKHISSVRVKMMTTLRTGLRYKDDFPQLCCKAEVQDFLHEIYFLPDHHELKEIQKVLQDYRKQTSKRTDLQTALQQSMRAIQHENVDVRIHALTSLKKMIYKNQQTSKSTDLQTALQQSMRAIQHENVDVRIHALTSLKKMIYKNQEKLIKYVLDSETVEPIISQLVTVLLKGSQDANPEARLLCGECLGEMGAIDPGRLDLSITDTQGKSSMFVSGVEDSSFAYELLTELTRAFLAYADDVRAQDSAAYAMQELLAMFECREGRSDCPGRRLWRRFPEHVQEILEPHLNSRYKSTQKVLNWSKIKKPIYLSSLGSNFAEWSAMWAGYLVTNVRDELASKVFNCCSFIMKHDYKVTIYLLPHILVYVLLGCTQEYQQEVYAEIMAVLTEEDPRITRLHEIASDLSQLSTQTVFSMLDHLTQWARHTFQALNMEKSAGQSSRDRGNPNVTSTKLSEYQSVKRFLDLIPQDTLARASFRSKAYTRAVMHFESFFFEKKQNIQDHLSFLQSLYAAMHEPDGVTGVNAIRKEEPSLREQILEHESIGLLRDATACYDRAIQLESDQILHYHGVMKSMLGLGQLSTVITQWARHAFQALNMEKSAGQSSRDRGNPNVTSTKLSEYQSVKRFLDLIPQDTLARASFRSKAYTRAVMHFESFFIEKKQNIQDHLSFLQSLYAAMHEPDGVTGVNAIRKEEPSLREQILEHESIGLLRDATACYDRAIQLESDQILHYHGVMKSMLGLGQLSTVITQVNGVLANRPQWKSELNTYRVEAAWKLSQWDLVGEYLASDQKSSKWSVRLGQLLLAAKQKDAETFYEKLKVVRAEQVVPLSAASFEWGSYQRGYEYIVRLHVLCELEHTFKDLQNQWRKDGTKEKEQTLNWQARLEMTQNSFHAKEPIIALRRGLLSLSKRPNYGELVGECWLQSARVARKAGHHQTAYNALLNAGNSSLSELYVEKAKWLWSKGDVHQALIMLQKGVQQCFPENEVPTDPKSVQIKGRAMLLVGRFMEETANFESNAVMKAYKDVTNLLPEWEDGNFYLAKYYDKLMPMVTENKTEKQGDLIRYIVLFFGKSLQFGNQYIYQSMPRMLSLWLDFGAKVYEWEKAGRADRLQMRSDLAKINRAITEHTNHLAPYQFLTAFSQLISRICHSHDEVFTVLTEIIAKVFLAYPQQAMWMMTAVCKSSYPTRVNRCKEILRKAINLKDSLGKFIGDADRLTDKLLELCNKRVDSPTFSMSIHFKLLKKLVEEPTFSQILIPLQSVMTPTLPSTAGAHANHEPFPGHWAYIAGFDDTIEVLASLQKPKKVSLRGSDGKFYTMMCKPKDDLRKDCRLMEFNSLINKCLRKDAESRRRELHIRTYSVIPLNEECGIIEWVNNTAGLRNILNKLYKEKGICMTTKELRQFITGKSTPFQEKLKMYKEILLPRHPPVFHEWFLRTFPDPTSWYSSRSAYCRSTAVISMVGYILGLGDRHGENILFDSLTGECVHVDFNCLFNKGETFEVPEVVPFRLTHNMVHAMGPMGTEGLFRQACEVTMRLMRDQREPLMSVLKTFLHDPLVEWSKPVKGNSKSQVNESGEVVNEKAKTHVLDIEQRLQGVIKNRNKIKGLPLSIEGHVHYLIQEATDENLLCQMYIGWAPYF